MTIFELLTEEKQPEERTLAAALETAYTESRSRIAAADLTDAQRKRLLQDVDKLHIIGTAAADILERIPAVDGKVYDINSKAAMIGGEVFRGSNYTSARRTRTGEGWNAYVSSSTYGNREYITIYPTGVGSEQREIQVVLSEAEGKKPRIDGDKTAESVRGLLQSVTEEITKSAVFAENVKALEAKKAAVMQMIEEIRGTVYGNYETVKAFGLYPDSYRPFYSRTVY